MEQHKKHKQRIEAEQTQQRNVTHGSHQTESKHSSNSLENVANPKTHQDEHKHNNIKQTSQEFNTRVEDLRNTLNWI